MAKMFAKITKTFTGLSVTIVAKGRILVLILHLEAKYAKMDCKNEIYSKNWVRSTWTAKVNSGKKSQWSKSTLGQSQRLGQHKSTVWSTRVNSLSTMTSADVAGDVSGDVVAMTSPRADVSRCKSGA